MLAPPDAGIRDDAVAVARLLRQLAPTDGEHVAVPPTLPERHVGAVLNGAVQVMADVAVHEGTTFDRLARGGLLHIPARALPRNLVTDHPEIAAARLAGHVVPAPRPISDDIAELFASLAAHPITSSTSPPLPQPTEAAAAPLHAVPK